MATLSEKLRACLTLNPEAAAAIYVDGSRALVLDANDLAGIADALSGRDSLVRERDEAIAAADDIRIHNARTEELAAERDAAKRDLHQATSKLAAVESELSAIRAGRDEWIALIAALRAELAEATDAEPFGWVAQTDCDEQFRVTFAVKAQAEYAAKTYGGEVFPLYRHPPPPEALPTREDLETVLKSAAVYADVQASDEVQLREHNGLYTEVSGWDMTPRLTFAEAVTEAARLLREAK